MSEATPLSCPFCKGEATTRYIRDGRQAVCKKCGASGPPKYHGPDGAAFTNNHAVESWNTRPPLQAAAPELLAELTEVDAFIGGWREMIAELEDFCGEPVRLKGMMAALNQIDSTRPKIRAAIAAAKSGGPS